MTFRNVISSFNPFEIRRQEREKDRQLLAHVVSEVCDALRVQQETLQTQTGMIQQFLKGFEVNGEPETRVVRTEDEVKAAMERYGVSEDEAAVFNPFATPTNSWQ